MIDAIEFAEKYLGIKLLPYQKILLNNLDKINKVMYIYSVSVSNEQNIWLIREIANLIIDNNLQKENR